MKMNFLRGGHGKPLLLVHGLGSQARTWSTVWTPLVESREVFAIDLPGFGATPPLPAGATFARLVDAVAAFVESHGLTGIDAVGSSMGARLVLELARRGGVVGAVVALDPGGFWQGWERRVFHASVWTSVRLVRLLQPVMPALCASPLGRSLLLAQFSKRPRALSPDYALEEMRTFARSPSFDDCLRSLVDDGPQQGAPAGSIGAPLVIGWGRSDRVCLPRQAPRALAAFPDAQLHWFERCGHFPHWDRPDATARLILDVTGGAYRPSATSAAPAASTPLPDGRLAGAIASLDPSVLGNASQARHLPRTQHLN